MVYLGFSVYRTSRGFTLFISLLPRTTETLLYSLLCHQSCQTDHQVYIKR